MGKVTVWTKQHKNVLRTIEETGTYRAKKDVILKNEEVKLMFHSYEFLIKNHPDLKNKPSDADFPVWVSFKREGTMLLTPDTVILKLRIDENIITKLNVIGWTKINNLSYIGENEKDEKRHRDMLSLLGITDFKACTTQFYPDIRREVEESWKRAFSTEAKYKDELFYGLIWEIKKEWVEEIEK